MKRSFQRAMIGILGGMLLAMSLAAQFDPGQPQVVSPEVKRAVSDAAAKYKIPGIAVALIDHGQLTGIEVFGVRDTKSNAPVTRNTVFEAGSLGESLYAYAVLRLAADRQFDPGMPLTAYLPLPYIRDLDPTSLSVATESIYDPRLNQITAFRVMNHTTGMPDWARNTHMFIQAEPGQEWSYSNEGYLYLQRVVEHATGERLAALLQRTVFGPAGMAHSSFTWRDNLSGQLAIGHGRSGAPLEADRYMQPAAGATLYTTIEDYARFVTLILASAPAQRAHESAVSLMLRPTVTAEDSFSWGLGCGLEKSDDDLLFFNRGANPGFQSFVMASRKTGKGIVILTNSENGLAAVSELVSATIGGNHPIFKSTFFTVAASSK
jgi:CubicO group peptidase (beta-lactamase class C family)